MRRLAIAAGGILLVGGGAIAVILATGGDPASPDLPPVTAAAPAPPPVIPVGPLPGIGADGKAVRLEAPPVEFEPEPPPPDAGSWEAIPAASRPNRMGPIGPVLANELSEVLQPRLAQCFDEETQSRFGQTPVSRPLNGREADDAGTILLVLNVEVSPGQVRIADAPVEQQGPASDGTVACAQRVLRGHVVRTPVATDTRRVRMAFQLHP